MPSPQNYEILQLRLTNIGPMDDTTGFKVDAATVDFNNPGVQTVDAGGVPVGLIDITEVFPPTPLASVNARPHATTAAARFFANRPDTLGAVKSAVSTSFGSEMVRITTPFSLGDALACDDAGVAALALDIVIIPLNPRPAETPRDELIGVPA